MPDGQEAKCAAPSLTFPLILRPMLSEQAATHGTCGSLSSYLTETETEAERENVKSILPTTSLFLWPNHEMTAPLKFHSCCLALTTE